MDQKGSVQNLQKVLINKYFCMPDFVKFHPDLSSFLMHRSHDLKLNYRMSERKKVKSYIGGKRNGISIRKVGIPSKTETEGKFSKRVAQGSKVKIEIEIEIENTV